MATLLGLITLLEKTPITREILESTRLGKYINEIRRHTTHPDLSRRAKDLLRKWRKDVLIDKKKVNGLPLSGPGNGHCISPPLSISRVASPCSLPSSGQTSPGIISAPTTPSTLGQKTLSTSPPLATGHSQITTSLVVTQSKASTIGLDSIFHSTSSNLVGYSKSLVSDEFAQQSNTDVYSPNVENVSRTYVANKRLRKDNHLDSSASKGLKCIITNGYDDDCSRESFCSVPSNDGASHSSEPKVLLHTINKSKRGRPKKEGKKYLGRNMQENASFTLDGVSESVQKISKPSKVKTTLQLVVELAEKKGDLQLAERASRLEQVREQINDSNAFFKQDAEHVTRNKMEHMERFLKSQADYEEVQLETEVIILDNGEDISSPECGLGNLGDSTVSKVHSTMPSNLDLLGVGCDESAEEILARLPPLNMADIVWDDCNEVLDDDEKYIADSDSDDEIERIVKASQTVDPELINNLHTTNLEFQNGNCDFDGRFREWHEVTTQKGYQDSPLIVLPYVITDF